MVFNSCPPEFPRENLYFLLTSSLIQQHLFPANSIEKAVLLSINLNKKRCMKQFTLTVAIATMILSTTACKKILDLSSVNDNKPLPTVIHAVYLLECKFKDSSGFPGILVTDSVSMRVRINDSIVTITDIVNFPSKAAPDKIVSGNTTIAWVPDAVGALNITGATGEIAIDFLGQDSSLLGLHFTHTGTHSARYHRIIPPNVDQYWGGDADPGILGGTSFTIISTKKQYNNGPPEKTPMEVKMTLQ
jgi:hypothetical protein